MKVKLASEWPHMEHHYTSYSCTFMKHISCPKSSLFTTMKDANSHAWLQVQQYVKMRSIILQLFQ